MTKKENILLSLNNEDLKDKLKTLLIREFDFIQPDDTKKLDADLIISDNTHFLLPDPDINSVTGLPGINTITSILKKTLISKRPLSIISCNINHFKEYNSSHGYSAGNSILEYLANLLKESIKNSGSSENFTGHAYNDFFITIIDSDKAVTISDYIITRFDDYISDQIQELDDSEQFINREGDLSKLPKISLRLAGVDLDKYEADKYLLVFDTIHSLLKRAKYEGYSCIFFDRRNKP